MYALCMCVSMGYYTCICMALLGREKSHYAKVYSDYSKMNTTFACVPLKALSRCAPFEAHSRCTQFEADSSCAPLGRRFLEKTTSLSPFSLPFQPYRVPF